MRSDLLLALLPSDNAEVEAVIDDANELLDMADGDSDLKETRVENSFCEHELDGPGCLLVAASQAENGDERDGTNAEDEIVNIFGQGTGAGCPISDPGGCQHDGREHEEGL
jgi:hypothetical protein